MRFLATAAALLAATPAFSGGLFTDGGLLPGAVDGAVDGSIDGPLDAKNATEALRDWEKQLALPAAPAPGAALKSYEELLKAKTTDQLKIEADLAKRLGLPVSNICLTSAGACEVSYTTKGSTCFCSTADAFELGIVQ